MPVRDRREPVSDRVLVEVRCQKCNRLLLKCSDRAVCDGKMIEIKCWKCDDMNYLMGGPSV